jgi:glycine/D-amino acid oxidase-like deaminating enzyme
LLGLSGELRADKVMIGKRLVPLDGLPVIGEPSVLGGLYIAMMHSGITLAPLVGRLVADEIISHSETDLLAPYRPDRLAPA